MAYLRLGERGAERGVSGSSGIEVRHALERHERVTGQKRKVESDDSHILDHDTGARRHDMKESAVDPDDLLFEARQMPYVRVTKLTAGDLGWVLRVLEGVRPVDPGLVLDRITVTDGLVGVNQVEGPRQLHHEVGSFSFVRGSVLAAEDRERPKFLVNLIDHKLLRPRIPRRGAR